MKKIIIAAVSLFVALTASAQIGVVAGLTSSSTDLKTAVATVKDVNQYHAGLTYKMSFGGLLAIQPSIIYNMKGQTLEQNLSGIQAGTSASIDYKTGYLEVPVQVQIGFSFADLARVYGFAEPFVGYAITNEVISQIANQKDVQKTWDNVKEKLEYGVSLGVGVELFSHLQLSVKYFWNMGDAYGTDIKFGNISSTIAESKCNGISASVAYLF